MNKEQLEKDILDEQLLEYLPNKNVVFAVLHGSRAYGLSTKDSDYDVKFVWIEDYETYTGISEVKNTGYSEQKDNVDVSGWELKHFLNLVRKNNMTTVELYFLLY